MTLEETARYFSRIWGKDVNRTHIARIKNHARAAQEHLDDDGYDGPYHHPAPPSAQLAPVVPPVVQATPVVPRGDLTIGTGVPPTPTIPQQFIRSQAPLNVRPDRPQAPPPPSSLQHKHPLFNNFMIPPQFKFQKECYNNNHEELIRSNQFQANYDYQLHLQKQQQLQQQQQAKQLDDGDSGISVGSSISPTSNIEHTSPQVSRGSVIMSTKSALSRINTNQPVKRETIEVNSVQSMAEKVFNCPQCDWQSYDKAKFWEHITSNHFKNMVLPKLATLPGENAEKPTDAELDVIDIKTQPIESDDVIMMS